MKRPRKKPPRKARNPKKRPRSQKRTPAPRAPREAAGADPLAEAPIRPLLERYCKLAGVKRSALSPDHSELTLPKAERPFFRDRAALRVAFSLDALERDPDAEIAVLGSPFLSQLLEAIRARAARLSLGLLAPAGAADPKSVELTIPVRDGTITRSSARLAVHPVGRLVARVVLRAGAGVEEAMVESDVFDLSAGAKLGDDVAALFEDLEAGRVEPADPALGRAAKAQLVPARAPAELVTLLLAHLQDKSAERVAVRRAAAERDLALELGRLDRYFESILKDQSDPDGVGTVSALAERRRTEEIRRSQVKAVVHPLQLIEAAVLMQHAEWQVESSRDRGAPFTAQRPVGESGAAAWIIACPHCGRPPAELVVCRYEHGACDACASRCSVCAEDFCAAHGIAQCRVDDQPACDEHVRVCPSCRLEYCTAHEGVCSVDDHTACSTCLAPCGSCGRLICNRHAEQSSAEAPKGRRRLCGDCLRYCEGGGNERVGLDEVAQCASCGKSVCTEHQAVCAVDEQVHCSQHMRRTDTSQRFVCARHRAGCALEGVAVLASDEVAACTSCGKLVCATHSAECVGDGLRHCVTHLEALVDVSGSFACGEHRKQCVVDGEVFSLAGVNECPICGRSACARHRAACQSCGRQVCAADLAQQTRRCATCTQLAKIADPPAEVLAAARAATGGQSRSARWRMARDRTHQVVEVDLGLKRKTVFTLRHGETAPDSVVRHSLLGSNLTS